MTEEAGWRPQTSDEKADDKRERRRAYSRKYYLLNRERLLVKSRNDYDRVRDVRCAKQRERRAVEREEEGRELGRHRVLKPRTLSGVA